MRSDRALEDQVLKGDTAAYETLYGRYEGVVRRQLLGTVRDETAAEDLVQEVFLRLWTRAAQWRGEGALGGWLIRAATNLAFNYLRSMQRRRQEPLEGLVDEHDPDDTNQTPGWLVDAATLGPDVLLEQAEQQRLLHGCIATLPEEKREVLRLVYDAQMEVREVAAELSIPEGTVKSRLHNARKQLAQQWRQIDFDG